MANTQHITPNRLAKEAWRIKKIILLIGIPAAAAVIFFAPNYWWVALFLPFVPFLNIGTIKSAGAKGEDTTLGILSGLPDSFTLLNQINIPDPTSSTGSRELDFVIVGPNGVFVVEVKHNNSEIYGREDTRDWTVIKTGRGGTRYSTQMRNPIKQVKKQVWVLSNLLKERKHQAWVEGIVFFSNPNSSVEIEGTPSVKVLQQNGLVEYIKNYIPKRPPGDTAEIAKDLATVSAAALIS